MFSMPNGAKPGGIFGSANPPSVVAGLKGRPTPAAFLFGAYTSMVQARKLVANSKTPLFALTPKTSPL